MPRQYAHEKEVHSGDWLMADGGFNCILENTPLKIKVDRERGMYIECECGNRHYLENHTNARGSLIGFYKCEGMQ